MVVSKSIFLRRIGGAVRTDQSDICKGYRLAREIGDLYIAEQQIIAVIPHEGETVSIRIRGLHNLKAYIILET